MVSTAWCGVKSYFKPSMNLFNRYDKCNVSCIWTSYDLNIPFTLHLGQTLASPRGPRVSRSRLWSRTNRYSHSRPGGQVTSAALNYSADNYVLVFKEKSMGRLICIYKVIHPALVNIHHNLICLDMLDAPSGEVTF